MAGGETFRRSYPSRTSKRDHVEVPKVKGAKLAGFSALGAEAAAGDPAGAAAAEGATAGPAGAVAVAERASLDVPGGPAGAASGAPLGDGSLAAEVSAPVPGSAVGTSDGALVSAGSTGAEGSLAEGGVAAGSAAEAAPGASIEARTSGRTVEGFLVMGRLRGPSEHRAGRTRRMKVRKVQRMKVTRGPGIKPSSRRTTSAKDSVQNSRGARSTSPGRCGPAVNRPKYTRMTVMAF